MVTSVRQMLETANAAVPKITPDQASDMIKKGNTLVVDVRDAPEVSASGKIAGAVNVSRGMLEFRADPDSPYHDKNFDKEKTVILYCASGGRSALAGKVLKDMGYEKAYNVGGFKDWNGAGEKGTVVVFICNHCPYVKAVIDRIVADARVLMSEGVGFAAICSNDAASYPEDSFENMKRFAKAHDFPFPYLHDETQTVARAYGAVCTPDFFGYNADRKLKYRGRLDEGRTTPPRAGAPRELVEAMRAIATTGLAPADQKASIGCSIKWKDE